MYTKVRIVKFLFFIFVAGEMGRYYKGGFHLWWYFSYGGPKLACRLTATVHH